MTNESGAHAKVVSAEIQISGVSCEPRVLYK